MHKVKEKLDLYHATNEGTKKASTRPSQARVRWNSPTNSYYKTNWDAAINNKGRKVDFEVFVRDSEGKVLACHSISQDFYSQPIVAKCLAL